MTENTEKWRAYKAVVKFTVLGYVLMCLNNYMPDLKYYLSSIGTGETVYKRAFALSASGYPENGKDFALIGDRIFPVTEYTENGGNVDKEEALRLWTHETAIPNYYLAEKYTFAGKTARQLKEGDTVVISGTLHRIIGVINGINHYNGEEEADKVHETIKAMNAWGAIQTCIKGPKDMRVYILN